MSQPGAAEADQPGGLRVRELRLVMRGLVLLDGLSLDLRAGEILAVRGASGAGKTTLLRTLAGLLPAPAGEIDTGGGRGAMVFQEPRLLPWYSAEKNVTLALRHLPDAPSVARDWLQRVGLDDAMQLRPAQMSGGMRQRTAIARALAARPTLLLVDEPFSALNPELAQTLRDLLLDLIHRNGISTVWVTHNPDEAAAVSDRLLFMDGPPGTFRLSTGSRQTA